MSKERKILVSLSGGLDSTTLTLKAKEEFDEVAAISFNYGERNVKELDYAKRLAAELGIKHHILDARYIASLNNNSYLTHNADNIAFENGKKLEEVEDKSTEGLEKEGIPNTFVPGRNFFFIGMAAVYAHCQGFTHIGIGVNSLDFSGYPDCKPNFIKSIDKTINLALGLYKGIKIWRPFQYYTKVQILEEADKLGRLEWVLNNTLSCYNGIENGGCGECPSCIIRNEAIAEYKKYKENK